MFPFYSPVFTIECRLVQYNCRLNLAHLCRLFLHAFDQIVEPNTWPPFILIFDSHNSNLSWIDYSVSGVIIQVLTSDLTFTFMLLGTMTFQYFWIFKFYCDGSETRCDSSKPHWWSYTTSLNHPWARSGFFEYASGWTIPCRTTLVFFACLSLQNLNTRRG